MRLTRKQKEIWESTSDCANHRNTLDHLTMTLRKKMSTWRTPSCLLQHWGPGACRPEQRPPRNNLPWQCWHLLRIYTFQAPCFIHVVSLNLQPNPVWLVLLLTLCYKQGHWSTENLCKLPQTTQLISEEPKVEPKWSDGRDYSKTVWWQRPCSYP